MFVYFYQISVTATNMVGEQANEAIFQIIQAPIPSNFFSPSSTQE
jgi:hypothetical protein